MEWSDSELKLNYGVEQSRSQNKIKSVTAERNSEIIFAVELSRNGMKRMSPPNEWYYAGAGRWAKYKSVTNKGLGSF